LTHLARVLGDSRRAWHFDRVRSRQATIGCAFVERIIAKSSGEDPWRERRNQEREKTHASFLGMKARGFWVLGHVSDECLQRDLATLLASGSRTEARIIAHLAELEERRLHTKAASESLFAYCTQRLGLSESEAFHRITAARLARLYPMIFDFIERRLLHLTAVCLLRDYLTLENHLDLLTEASHKTKWQVQELIARRFPRPDVPSTVRKLPVRALAAPPANLASVPTSHEIGAPSIPVLVPASIETSAPPTPRLQAPTSRTEPASLKPESVRLSIEPLSEARYRIQLNATSALKEKLDLARALISHSNPGGDIAVVIERAIDLLIEKVQRRRFGKTERPRATRAPCVIHAQRQPSEAKSSKLLVQTKSMPAVGGGSSPSVTARTRAIEKKRLERRREHIPNATRRAIVERDGLRCTFVSESGHRCEARSLLQIHHENPWALGGPSETENLRLLCGAHNQLLAQEDFGAEHIARQIAVRR
jgi:5-methylcytosine-specific restriction endonuclease McrA